MNPDSIILDMLIRLNAELIQLREQTAKQAQRIKELEAERAQDAG